MVKHHREHSYKLEIMANVNRDPDAVDAFLLVKSPERNALKR